MQEYEINVEWTLESMKDSLANGESEKDICFSCAEDEYEVREFTIAVKNNKLQWTDASGAVWEKTKVKYCKKCAIQIINSLIEATQK